MADYARDRYWDAWAAYQNEATTENLVEMFERAKEFNDIFDAAIEAISGQRIDKP